MEQTRDTEQGRDAPMLAVPEELAEDLERLVELLGSSFCITRWRAGESIAGATDAPVLLDVRVEARPDINPLKDTARPLVLILDEARPEMLEQLGGHPVLLVSLSWAVEFAAEYIRVGLQNLAMVGALFEAQLDRLRGELAAGAEERGIELLLTQNELNRYKEFKTGVLQRLGDSERGYIAEILRHTKIVAEKAAGNERLAGSIEAITRSAQSIERILSHDFWTRAEEALRGRSILVVSGTRKSRRMLVRSLIGTGVSVQAASNVDEGLAVLGGGPIDIMYVDWENSALINPALKLYPQLQTVLMTSELVFENAGKEMLDLPLSNVLITSDVGMGDSRDAILIRELTVTAGKLLSGDIFGLEKYLAWGTAIREAKVTGSQQRFELLDRVGDYAQQCGLRQSLCQNLETLTDELLMNAIWDAPADEQGNAKYGHLSRQDPLDLQDDECAILRYGSDSNLLGISVSDRWGRLDRDLAFRYLVKCFARREVQTDSKSGGAGLGLYYAFLSVSSFVINVAPGSRTEVIGLLDMNISPRELMVRPRSYLYFRSPVPVAPLF